MSKSNEIARKANEWIGLSNSVTGETIAALIWAMAMDDDLADMFAAEVQNQRADYQRQVRLAYGD